MTKRGLSEENSLADCAAVPKQNLLTQCGAPLKIRTSAARLQNRIGQTEEFDDLCNEDKIVFSR